MLTHMLSPVSILSLSPSLLVLPHSLTHTQSLSHSAPLSLIDAPPLFQLISHSIHEQLRLSCALGPCLPRGRYSVGRIKECIFEYRCQEPMTTNPGGWLGLERHLDRRSRNEADIVHQAGLYLLYPVFVAAKLADLRHIHTQAEVAVNAKP